MVKGGVLGGVSYGTNNCSWFVALQKVQDI